MATAVGHPVIERAERDVVEGNGAFGVELAERDTEPRAGALVVHDAAKFEIEEFPDA